MTDVINLAALAVVFVSLAYVLMLFVDRLRSEARGRLLFEAEMDAFKAKVAHLSNPVVSKSLDKQAGWQGVRKFRIAGKVLEADSICSFYLEPHDGRPLPPFQPGQYLTFQLDIPGQPRRVTRCYSLSDSPTQTGYYRVSIKRIPPPRDKPEAPPGLSSSFFHDRLEVDTVLDVKAPAGHFFMDVNAEGPVVLIGGGIGITPVLSMLNYIVESGSGREAHLFYGVRNSDELVMKDYLRELAQKHDNVHLHVCMSDPGEDDLEGIDYDHAERVSVDLFKRELEVNNFDFYICGPPPMMSSITEGLADWGVPEARVHFEAFGPASVKKVAQPEKESSVSEGLELEFKRSGKTLVWDGASNSILEFAEANGINLDCGCRSGSCGTCMTAIRSGDVEYVTDPDADVEKGHCLTCISVPKTALSLDA